MRKKYTRRPVYHRSHYCANWFCWAFAIFWLLILAGFIVLAVTTPTQTESFYRESIIKGNVRQHADECTESEIYDNDLGLCAPVVQTPTPIDVRMMNNDRLPCDSFFHHMSGHWIEKHKNENRAFSYLYQKNRKQIHDIIKDPASGPVYNFYRSCLDTLVLKQHRAETLRQIRHVKEYIVGALQTHADLPIVFARLAKYGFNGPFSMVIESHPTKSKMIPLFRYDTVPGLHTDIANRLNMWHTVLEENMAKDFISYVENGQYKRDIMSMQALVKPAPKEFWKNYLREINGVSSLEVDLITNVADQEIWVIDRSYFEHFLANIKRFSVDDWRTFVLASIRHNTEDFLPVLPSDSYFRQHEHKPIGSDVFIAHKLQKDEKKIFSDSNCLMVTHKLLPGLVAKEFLHRDMPHSEATRARVTQMVENLRTAYAQLVRETKWLSEQTKQLAVEKIQSMIVRAVHPNTWESEPFAMRLTRDRYLRNLNMIRRYRVERNYELWTVTRKELNRDVIQRFGAPLTTVNAYYSPITNTITVFAGLIREPFYSRRFSDVALYATLGMVCGHELSHGLDPFGRHFDKEGSIKKWWTAQDVEHFQQLTTCVSKEYIAPVGCNKPNYGQQTLPEDVADITGISIAWKAFNTAHPEATDEDKRNFFKIFAQLWAESYDSEHLCGKVESDDVHAIAWYRVDKTLRQIPDFALLFGCKANDKMVNNKPCRIYG